MKRPFKIVLLLVILLSISFAVWNLLRENRRVTDSNFVMVENTLSPDGQHRILYYHYDHGALDSSRAWWAITPPEYQDLNLANYELPNCYETEGWLDANELLVLRQEPCQYREKRDELKTGDLFNGVKVQVVLNSNFLRGKGLEQGSPPPPPQ